MQIRKSLIELPAKGKALIVTDIHGNLSDFEKYMELWRKFKDKYNHLILTGDYIHNIDSEDNSIEILNSLMQYYEHERNFHVLLGNHEWSHVSGVSVYKAGINQKLLFELQMKEHFGNDWKHQLNIYINFFRKLPVAVRTQNGVFISHAAPAKDIKDINDIINITDNGYGMYNKNLFEMLWNRYPYDYNKNDIDEFLRKVGCKVSVVGHTVVNGYDVIGNQIILSSSLSYKRKCYIELDLEKEIENVNDVCKMIKDLV